MNTDPGDALVLFINGEASDVQVSKDFIPHLKRQHGPVRHLPYSEMEWAHVDWIRPRVEAPFSN